MVLPVILPSLLCVASAAALLYARRGRRVDDHPVCRKCGFDLFGSPLRCKVCSECGADLTRPRAARRGRRERRGRLLAVAAPVLAVCLAWFGVLGWGAARGADWTRHKPAWLLLREGRGQDVGVRDAALVELTGRFKNGGLSEAHAAALLDLALDIQGDRWRPWTDAVGDVIGAAKVAKRLSREQLERYARQAAPPQLKLPAELRGGDWPYVDVAVCLPTPRLARGDAPAAFVQCIDLKVGESNVAGFQGSRTWGLINGLRPPGDLTFGLPVGRAIPLTSNRQQTVRATVHRAVWDPSLPNGRGMLIDEQVELTSEVTVVPAVLRKGQFTIELRLREAVEKSVTVKRLGLEPDGGTGQGSRLSLHVRAAEPPVGLAFRAALRAGNREWDLGPVCFPPGRTSECVVEVDPGRLRRFHASRVDVVFRPSAEEAIRTAYLTEIWGDVVVVKDVAVDPPLPRQERRNE